MGMTWDELAWEFEMIKELDERVSKNIRESAERERAYARNRRTSPFLGAEIYLWLMPPPRDTFSVCGTLQRNDRALATHMEYCIGMPASLPNTPR